MRLINTILFFVILIGNSIIGQSSLEVEGNLLLSPPLADTSESQATTLGRSGAIVTNSLATSYSQPVEAPQELPLYSNYADYGIGYHKGIFYKHKNRVYLEGLLRSLSGNVAKGDTLFILPDGYRPCSNVILLGKQQEVWVRLQLTSNGVVKVITDNSVQDWISLTNLSFYSAADIGIEEPHLVIKYDFKNGLQSQQVCKELTLNGNPSPKLLKEGSRDFLRFGDFNHATLNSPSFELDSSYTIAFWMRSDDYEPDQKLIGQAQVFQHGFLIGVEANRIKAELFPGFSLRSENLTTRVWTHVALVVTSDNGKLYVNGVKEIEAQHEAVSSPDTYPLYLGLAPWGSFPYTGDLDDIYIYNKALSETEVQEVMDR